MLEATVLPAFEVIGYNGERQHLQPVLSSLYIIVLDYIYSIKRYRESVNRALHDISSGLWPVR